MRKYIALILISIMCFLTVGMPVFAQDAVLIGNFLSSKIKVGEQTTYVLMQISQNTISEVTDYTVSYDDTKITVDKNLKTITGIAEGCFQITFATTAASLVKTINVVDTQNVVSITQAPVYSEDFESDANMKTEFKEALAASPTRYTILSSGGNRSFQLTAASNLFQLAFGPNDLTDYIVSADTQVTTVGGTNGANFTVGMRDDSKGNSYKFSNNSLLYYVSGSHSAGVANTPNATLYNNTYSLGRQFDGAVGYGGLYYHNFILNAPSSMWVAASKAHNKMYKWEVAIDNGTMTAKVIDKQNGQALVSTSCPLTDLNYKLDGTQISQIESGKTNISAHSNAVLIDNITISPIAKVDDIKLNLSKSTITGQSGDDSVTYTVEGFYNNNAVSLADDYYFIFCDSPNVAIDNGNRTITASQPGSYDIVLQFISGGKLKEYTATLDVGYDAEIESINLPAQVKVDFDLQGSDEVMWISNKPSIISVSNNKAIVNRPAPTALDETVVLSAITYKNQVLVRKDFSITVFKEIVDIEGIEAAHNTVNIPESTITDIILPTEFDEYVTATWISSNEAFITNSGEVTRPIYEDETVSLTASFQRGETVKNYVYKVMVVGLHQSPPGSGGGGGTKKSGTTSYTDLPAAPTPTPAPIEEPKEESFSDLSESKWAVDAVDYLKKQGIINGSDGKFLPNNHITREEFVKLIIGAFHITGNDAVSGYTDNSSDKWYYAYLNIAKSNGIVYGKPDGSFGVGENITREDMAVILHRILKNKDFPLEALDSNVNFTDEKDISEYAVEAVKILKENGILNGNENNAFLPKSFATRAQAATVIYNILK